MLIDLTYFVGQITIPDRSSVVVQESLNQLIKIKEPEFLRSVLGVKMYNDLLENQTDQKYIDLLRGVDFTYKRREEHFSGLANPDTLTSAIARYVYCAWQENEWSTTFGSGEARSIGENSTQYNPLNKMLKAHNDNVTELHLMLDFIDSKKEDYPLFSPKIKHDMWYYKNPFGL